MKRWLLWSTTGLLLASALTLVVTADEPHYPKFSTFSVSGAVTLGVESINNYGTVAGNFSNSAGSYLSFVRAANGQLTIYKDHADTSIPGFTFGNQINNEGTVAGYFDDTAAGQYEGFFYNNGYITNLVLPDLPAYTTTGLLGINDFGKQICGFISSPPYDQAQAFNSTYGKVDIYSAFGSAFTYCAAVNNQGYSVGYYYDSAGAEHGFLRSPQGEISEIDFPGASRTPATPPCLTTPFAGTLALGVNDSGVISGHFWDKKYNEHGFQRFPNGSYIQIDVPGAFQTGGGGINDAGAIVGHYEDSSCNEYGYILNAPESH